MFTDVYVCGIGAKVFNKQPLRSVPDRLISPNVIYPIQLSFFSTVYPLSASLHSAREQSGFPLVPLGRCRLFGGS